MCGRCRRCCAWPAWIRLSASSPRLDFETHIDWREVGHSDQPNPILRVSFPVGTESFEARYALPFGDKVRPPGGGDVPALTWAWLMETAAAGAGGGFALLNDCKYGYSATPDGLLRLSLVRSSFRPDPLPDQYLQSVTYSLMLLLSSARPSLATRAGLELNQPLATQRLLHNTHNPFAGDRTAAALPPRHSLVTLDGLDDVIPTCLKRSDEGKALILRLYEADGRPASGTIRPGFQARTTREVNRIEDPLGPSFPIRDGTIPVALRPYEIKTLRIE